MPAGGAAPATGAARCWAASHAGATAQRDRWLPAAPAGGVRDEDAGDLKLAAPPLPADAAEAARLAEALRGRPVWLAASTHRRRGRDHHRHASEAGAGSSGIAHDHCAAPSRARRNASLPMVIARGGTRRLLKGCGSPIRWANSGCGIGSRRSPSSAAVCWLRAAGRIHWSRRGLAARLRSVRTPRIFANTSRCCVMRAL